MDVDPKPLERTPNMATKITVAIKLEGRLQGELALNEVDLTPEYLNFLSGFQSLLSDYENKVSNTSNGISIVDAGTAKIQAIKLIRTLTSMGLKESKDLIEAPVNRFIQASLLYPIETMIQMFSEIGAKAVPAKCPAGSPRALTVNASA